MKEKHFNAQKEACEYYGHSWKYIKTHYKVVRAIGWVGGVLAWMGYYITKQ